MKAERIVKIGEFKNTNKDKLLFINSVLKSGVNIGSLSSFPSIVYFSIHSISQKPIDLFFTLSGFELTNQIQTQVNSEVEDE